MKSYSTLQELLRNDERSRALYGQFPPDAQVALQEQRQNIHTYEDLQQLAAAFGKREASR